MHRFFVLAMLLLSMLAAGCHDGGGGDDHDSPQFSGSVATDAKTYFNVPESEAGKLLPHQPLVANLLDVDRDGIAAWMRFIDPSGIPTTIDPTSADGEIFVPYIGGGGWRLLATPSGSNFQPLETTFSVLPWTCTLWGSQRTFQPGQASTWEIRGLNGVPLQSGGGQETFSVSVCRISPQGEVEAALNPQYFAVGATSVTFGMSFTPGHYVLIGNRPQFVNGQLQHHATPVAYAKVLDQNGDVGLEFAGYKHEPNEFVPFTFTTLPQGGLPPTVSLEFRCLSSGEVYNYSGVDAHQVFNAWTPLISEHPLGLWIVTVRASWQSGAKTALGALWIQ